MFSTGEKKKKTPCHNKLSCCVGACEGGRCVCVCKHANTHASCVFVCVRACVCVCFLPVQRADKNKEPQTLLSHPLHLSLFPFRVKLLSNQLHKLKTTTCRAAAEAWQLCACVGSVWDAEFGPLKFCFFIFCLYFLTWVFIATKSLRKMWQCTFLCTKDMLKLNVLYVATLPASMFNVQFQVVTVL